MTLFTPNLTLIQEPDAEYTVHSVTLTPNSCFSAGPVVKGPPSGVVTIPEAYVYQFHLRHRAGSCLQVITPVEHQIQNLPFGPGKTSVICFSMLNGAIVGYASASPGRSLTTLRNAPAGDVSESAETVFSTTVVARRETVQSLTPQICIDLVIRSTPDGQLPSGGDAMLTLSTLGVLPGREDVFKSKVQGNLGELGFKIKQKDITAVADTTSVAECAGSVQSNAEPK